MMQKKYAFLGIGNMAGAIIGGITRENVSPANIALYDKFPTQYKPYENAGFFLAADANEAIRFADIVILAVKPQNFSELLESCHLDNYDGKCFVSIAAGISTEYICHALNHRVAVIRTMPNTPLLIGHGVTALCRNDLVTDRDFTEVCQIFACMGKIFTLPEEKMNTVIAATSSAPAYVYLLIRSIADAAQEQELGLDEKTLLDAISHMVIGSAEMVLQSGRTPDELIRMVTSPGGTTAEALRVFDTHDFAGTVAEAMEACTRRAEQLGNAT